MADTRHNGTAIRSIREARSLSRDQLASRIDKSYAHVANIELGNKDAAPELLQRIAVALDVPLEAILRRPLTDSDRKLSELRDWLGDHKAVHEAYLREGDNNPAKVAAARGELWLITNALRIIQPASVAA